jgi:hypothetical protein
VEYEVGTVETHGSRRCKWGRERGKSRRRWKRKRGRRTTIEQNKEEEGLGRIPS